MDNSTKLSSGQIEELIKKANDPATDTGVLLREHLTEPQAQKVQNIMNDPKKLQELLNSPIAKHLMELLGKKNGD